MGKIKKVLASANIEKPASTYLTIELCETIHVHTPTFRWELTLPQLLITAKIFGSAVKVWEMSNKPQCNPNLFLPLSGDYLLTPPPYQNRLVIEQQTIPSIHIHFRGLSLRMTIPEFKQFAQKIKEANENIE